MKDNQNAEPVKDSDRCVLPFQNGQHVLIHYATFNEISTFLHKENGFNYFININGKFGFSDQFIKKSGIILEWIDGSDD